MTEYQYLCKHKGLSLFCKLCLDEAVNYGKEIERQKVRDAVEKLKDIFIAHYYEDWSGIKLINEVFTEWLEKK